MFFFATPKSICYVICWFVYLFNMLSLTLGVYLTLKEIVHPKMKMLSSFTHPVFPTCMNVSVLPNTKEDILKNEGNRAVLDQSIFISYYRSQWCPKTARLQSFFRISSFVFSRTETFIQVWKYWVSKWWQNIQFGWTIPLKSVSSEANALYWMTSM